MIKVEHLETFNWEGAIRGMRNPLNSWSRSDSEGSKLGQNDLDLMRRLFKAGTEHRKYLRQIMVSVDITAPLFWWKEFDTYKVATVSNSCSTMHKITAKEFTKEDFSYDHMGDNTEDIAFTIGTINYLNKKRNAYLQTKDKNEWRKLIEALPTSYNQKRTITMNYETVVSIIRQRTNHKLSEWNDLVEILWTLPGLKEITEGKV